MAAFRLILAGRKRPPLRCGVPLLLARIESQITVPHRGGPKRRDPAGTQGTSSFAVFAQGSPTHETQLMLETERKGGFDFADDA
jgi:hypothetical protein